MGLSQEDSEEQKKENEPF